MATGWFSRIVAWSVLAMMPAIVLAAKPRDKNAAKGSDDASAASVEMFTAIENGQIDVKLIPKDSTESQIWITNKTNLPLSIKLPSGFAGVPVLAQAAGGAGRSSNNQPQAIGGDMGGGGGGGMGGGGGFFNIAPEKVGHMKVSTVCLEHGKKEPYAAVPYEIKPLESVCDKPGVRELCQLLSAGKIGQRVAQIVAWHLANDMSWDQLASKQWRFAGGGAAPYFTAQEIQAAMQVASTVQVLAQQQKSSTPSGKQESLSQK